MPDHAIVVSRGTDAGRKKVAHYALVCFSSDPLALRPRGAFDLSRFRNLGSSNPRVGASQVTAVLERHSSSAMAVPYRIDMAAELVEPYLVRLAGAVPLIPDERSMLDEAGNAHCGDAARWLSFARHLRDAALGRVAGGALVDDLAVAVFVEDGHRGSDTAGPLMEDFLAGLVTDADRARAATELAYLRDAMARGIVDAAARALDLAERVLDAANPNVLSDVGAALGCVRGGLTAAAVTLETNLGPLRDEGLEGVLRTDVDRADRLVARANALLGRVRAAVTG